MNEFVHWLVTCPPNGMSGIWQLILGLIGIALATGVAVGIARGRFH